MELYVLIPLIFTVLFLIVDVAMFIRMISIIKKIKDDETVKDLGNKLNPYLSATIIISVLMAICMILMTVLK